jgi:hypothetical protein
MTISRIAIPFVLMSLVLFLFSCDNSSPAGPVISDQMQIDSISPDTLLVQDSLTLFVVHVTYTLNTSDSASISVGFNNVDPNIFSMISYADTTVMKGSGSHSFSALVAPKKWATGIPFIVYVNMAKVPHASTFYPSATAEKKIYSFR